MTKLDGRYLLLNTGGALEIEVANQMHEIPCEDTCLISFRGNVNLGKSTVYVLIGQYLGYFDIRGTRTVVASYPEVDGGSAELVEIPEDEYDENYVLSAACELEASGNVNFYDKKDKFAEFNANEELLLKNPITSENRYFIRLSIDADIAITCELERESDNRMLGANELVMNYEREIQIKPGQILKVGTFGLAEPTCLIGIKVFKIPESVFLPMI